ncbi:MAG: alpha/beta hydrolase [Spirochaetales bacterium]|nr:alpha/beta hydrolase [Spirochaetales bacterium]
MPEKIIFIPLFILLATVAWCGGSQEDQPQRGEPDTETVHSGEGDGLTPTDQSGQTGYTDFTSGTAEVIKENMMPLFEEGMYRELSTEEQIFLDHYIPEGIPGSLHVGYFRSGETKLAAYLFSPQTNDADFSGSDAAGSAADSSGSDVVRAAAAGSADSEIPVKGTVLLLHGYLDHTLSNRYLIRFLLKQNYAVAAFDLHGHGLSGGEPVHIDDFREYAEGLARFINLLNQTDYLPIPPPRVAVAHSTGCSVLMEMNSVYGNPFDRVIFAAPLVQAVGWRVSGLGVRLADPFSDEVFRRFGGSSSNREHEDFVKNRDPLQSRRVPFSWVYAHENWVERMKDIPADNRFAPIILQGEEDSVVDDSYNIPFLREKYPEAQIFFIPEAEHSLFNEVPEIRNEVFEEILDILEVH